MDTFRFENREALTTPQTELEHLRVVVAEKRRESQEGGLEITPNQAARETIHQYTQTKPEEVLSRAHVLSEKRKAMSSERR